MPRSPSSASSSPTPSLDPSPQQVTEPTLSPDQLRLPSSPLFLPASPPPDPDTSSPSYLSSEGPDEAQSQHVGDDPVSPSAPRSTVSRGRLRELRDMAAGAIRTAGGLAHELLTREGTAERQVELFLPDQEDVDAISEPVAGLLSRRLPEGAENPDVADLVKLAIGVVGYAIKQKFKLNAAANIRRQADDLEREQGEPEPVDV